MYCVASLSVTEVKINIKYISTCQTQLVLHSSCAHSINLVSRIQIKGISGSVLLMRRKLLFLKALPMTSQKQISLISDMKDTLMETANLILSNPHLFFRRNKELHSALSGSVVRAVEKYSTMKSLPVQHF